jgi:predicted AAA+ superfamily ATPase
MDTGLSHYLKKYKFTEFRGIDAGKGFEHYILLELMAYKLLNDLDYTIQFWRTQNGTHEVDFILQDGKFALECKMSNLIERRDLKGLILFGEEYGAKLNVVSLEPRKRFMRIDSQEITIWPIEDFLNDLWSGKFF